MKRYLQCCCFLSGLPQKGAVWYCIVLKKTKNNGHHRRTVRHIRPHERIVDPEKQMLRVMQKLAYLYGVPNFILDADSLPDATMSKILSYGEAIFGLNRTKKSVGNAAHALVDNISGVIEKNTEGKKRILPFGRNKITDTALEVVGKTAHVGLSSASEVFGTMFSGGTNQLLFLANAERLKRQFEKTVLPSGNSVSEKEENIEDA